MSKKKTKSSASTNSTGTVTPNVPSFIQGPAQDYYSQVRGLLSGSMPATVGATPNQQRGFALASGLGVNSGAGEAMDATRALLAFNPSNVRTDWAPNAIAGPNANDYAGALMDAAPEVAAQRLAGADLTAYLNPFTSEVIDRSLGDLDRARRSAISGNQGAATMAGAYGGSRHGVADSLTNREFFDSAGNLAAGLRQAGFQNAQGMALADIANTLETDRFNASNALTVGARNQDAQNDFLRTLLSDRMTTQLANQGAAEAAAGRTQAGELANQQAGLAGQGLRLGAANQLGALGLAQDENTRANMGATLAAGSLERDIAQENDPVRQRLVHLVQIAQLLGIDPNDFIGQAMTQSGTQSGTASQSGLSFGFNWGPFSVGG